MHSTGLGDYSGEDAWTERLSCTRCAQFELDDEREHALSMHLSDDPSVGLSKEVVFEPMASQIESLDGNHLGQHPTLCDGVFWYLDLG